MFVEKPRADTAFGNGTDMAEGITHLVAEIAERIEEVAK